MDTRSIVVIKTILEEGSFQKAAQRLNCSQSTVPFQVRQLENELGAIGRGEELPEPTAFVDQLASNLIPQIGSEKFEGFTSEEMKLQNEGRKIMHLPELRVNCTCVRVPVLRSHSESITLEFEEPVSLEDAREALAAAPGVKLVDDLTADLARDRYPMPL